LGHYELTDAGDGFRRQGFLFATGATVTFEFREVEVTREPWRSDSLRPPS